MLVNSKKTPLNLTVEKALKKLHLRPKKLVCLPNVIIFELCFFTVFVTNFSLGNNCGLIVLDLFLYISLISYSLLFFTSIVLWVKDYKLANFGINIYQQ